MMNNPEIFYINQDTGEEVKLRGIATLQLSHDERDCPVNIHNSYQFQCSVDTFQFNKAAKELIHSNPSWKTACRLTDELNDLVEEYHAPGTPRRERRAIKREFDKIFAIFRKHCQNHGIDYKFSRLDK